MRRLSVRLVAVLVLVMLAATSATYAAPASDAPSVRTFVGATSRTGEGALRLGEELPLVTPADIVQPEAATWVTLFTSGFESGGTWNVTGSPSWGLTTYRKSGGAMSMYCAQRGIPAPGPYADNMFTWMIAGPFDLSGYEAATITYKWWIDTWPNDYLFVGASTNGVDFGGQAFSGTSVNWYTSGLDISACCGQPNVWIAFAFMSDPSGHSGADGAYVDDVGLEALPVRHAPVAVDDSFVVSQNKVKTVIAGLVANDYDVDGDQLAAYQVSSPSHGTAVVSTTGSFTYVPVDGYTGPDTFTYKLRDGDQYLGLYSNVATVYLNVVPDAPPIALDDSCLIARDAPRRVAAPGLLANDSDVADDPLNAVGVTSPLHGSVEIAADGSFSYAPDPGYVGGDSFTYQASDGRLLSAPATVSVTVVESPVLFVHRFYNARAGTHFYTADEAERLYVLTALSNVYAYEGVAYRLVPLYNDGALYRFYRPSTGTHFYTADPGERDRVIATLGHLFSYEGIGYGVSTSGDSGTKQAVHRFFRVDTGTHFYSADPAEVDRLLHDPGLARTYSYDGPAFFLGN